MPKLIIHLGLPKTGTTSLQNWFFPQVSGYLGKHPSPPPTDLSQTDGVRGLEMALRKAHLDDNWEENLPGLVNQLPFDRYPTMLLSEENFSLWRKRTRHGFTDSPVQKPFRGETARRGSHPIIQFLAEVRAALPPKVDLLTVITLRAQKTYLPSQAAQVGEHQTGQIVRRIIRQRDESILWEKLVRDLENLRGERRHMTLLFEDGVTTNARKIVRFGGLEARGEAFDFECISAANVRTSGDGRTWSAGTRHDAQRLRGVDGYLVRVSRKVFGRELPSVSRAYVRLRRLLLEPLANRGVRLKPRHEALLLTYVTPSNRSLARHLNRDLQALGYY